MAPLSDEGVRSVLIRRILSALVLIPLAVAIAFLGGWWFAGAVLLACAVVLYEWYKIVGAKALWAATAGLIAVWVAMAYHHSVVLSLYLLVMGAIGSAFLCMVRGGEGRAVWAAAGLVYVSVPMIALLWLMAGAGGLAVLWLFVVVWATDIGAFAIGRLVGGPKLMPAVSPGKTWAGAVGGLVAAIVASLIMTRYLLELEAGQAVILAIVASVAAQCGDLGQSWVKRRFKAKDSGTLIPGHGGLMDRVDGLIAAAVVFALIVAVFPALAGGEI